jgi:hypothetical protein
MDDHSDRLAAAVANRYRIEVFATATRSPDRFPWV